MLDLEEEEIKQEWKMVKSKSTESRNLQVSAIRKPNGVTKGSVKSSFYELTTSPTISPREKVSFDGDINQVIIINEIGKLKDMQLCRLYLPACS